MSITDKIIWYPLGEANYVPTIHPKTQIYLHHTASGPDAYGVVDYWKSNVDRVGTAFVIAGRPPTNSQRWKDGDIIQCFSSKYFAWHLGLTAKNLVPGGKTNTELNSQSIGIELCNWGKLTKTDIGFKTYAGNIIPESDVYTFDVPFRGSKYYQKYTDAQIESLRHLMLYLGETYHIPLKFKGMAMFDIDHRALMGEAGVFSHVSVRPPQDKQDCFPYPPLIQMLQSL